MNDIEKARDVLTKWREDSVSFPPGDAQTPKRLALVTGTAGNSDLLDAIDGLLWRWAITDSSIVRMYAELMAAAIVAADERMQQ
ncbi:hypothetical protein [Curtobacterium sp. SORGH_AS_0776]|uniref:hypothetical protein n=1 Tax=Curtobacterium sp. SORGH_AS_0776 TaxID=3041798 RepID=UPI00286BA592|nr:hypothetical protein [Curtobacterium sp. SORGH_AS_0776]